MGPASHQPEGKASTGTLGELLYAKAATPVSEQDWGGLVRSVAGGDQRALQALFERTHRLVFTLAVRITDNRETAEEVTLDVFHDVWRRASTYDAANGSVIGWIMNQARSRAIDRLRFDQRQKRVNHDPERALPVTDERDPQQVFDLREQGQRLRMALTVLTPAERQAVEVAFFSELTYHEVATRLDEPLGTVKTRIRSALTKLRQALISTVHSP